MAKKEIPTMRPATTSERIKNKTGELVQAVSEQPLAQIIAAATRILDEGIRGNTIDDPDWKVAALPKPGIEPVMKPEMSMLDRIKVVETNVPNRQAKLSQMMNEARGRADLGSRAAHNLLETISDLGLKEELKRAAAKYQVEPTEWNRGYLQTLRDAAVAPWPPANSVFRKR